MKSMKLICLLLFGSLLTGCVVPKTVSEKHAFYYVQENYLYTDTRQVLAKEYRKVSADPETFLKDYLAGPIDDNLSSPFPSGTTLVSLVQDDSCLQLTLSNQFAELSGIDLTIACSALSQTCFDVSDIQQLELRTESKFIDGKDVIIIRRDSYLFTDDSHLTKEEP